MIGHNGRVGLRRSLSWLAVGGVGAAIVAVAAAIVLPWAELVSGDPSDSHQVAAGERLYAEHCAACHGTRLEGQPNWQSRLPSGRFPAPPHDDSGHTWHHADGVLFAITKYGLKPPIAPVGYESDMPAFEGALSDDEIWAVLAFIKSSWSPEPRDYQRLVTEQSQQDQAEDL